MLVWQLGPKIRCDMSNTGNETKLKLTVIQPLRGNLGKKHQTLSKMYVKSKDKTRLNKLVNNNIQKEKSCICESDGLFCACSGTLRTPKTR